MVVTVVVFSSRGFDTSSEEKRKNHAHVLAFLRTVKKLLFSLCDLGAQFRVTRIRV